MNRHVSVISCGTNNLGSILNMLRRIDVPARIATSPADIDSAEKLILPGVGSFDEGMRALESAGLAEPLRRRVTGAGIPFLGICLGMQLLADGSEEGVAKGLGLVNGRCVRFKQVGSRPLKVPHMGWSSLRMSQPDPLAHGLAENSRFYFVHSYHFLPDDPTACVATADYESPFVAMIRKENIYGVQFHPEKSHRFGMALLGNFGRL